MLEINFKFDKRLAKGYYTAAYFKKTAKLAKLFHNSDNVCLQFTHFSSEPVKIAGINEAVQLLKKNIPKKYLKYISVYGVNEGDLIPARKPVLLILGSYQYFGIFENVIDGILARRSSVCNNCYQTLKLISTDQLIYMADRTDDYLLQKYDGYAAYEGGVRNFVTDASVEYLKKCSDVKVTGTVPHALIQMFDGNLNKALYAYHDLYPNEKLVALIDYHNDAAAELKKIASDFPDL